MSEVLQLFKPTDVIVEVAGKKEVIVFDMNAVLEMEKMYGSVDAVLKMLFSQASATYMVKVDGADVAIDSVTVNDTPLLQHLQSADAVAKSTIKDTINLLWIGLLHNHTKRDEDGEIISCDISKSTLREQLPFKKLAEVNTKIVTALIRDLIAPDSETNEGDVKN